MYEETREYTTSLALLLANYRKVMTGKELADHLNRNGLKTSGGKEWKGKRGTYGFLKSLYSFHEAKGNLDAAEAVALAFTTNDGRYAYA